ncbi:AraC family transcriptional regulator [Chryseobacterium gotjawalense]|uniref:AraC family transcriptional regulator n=1 Tax=Chryseobacterium gotjawalense TaxID=3042315 RepID=A0ABY8RBB8_9FLAO|nr:AraC family transcriptional regulator [Chryseobacterium sp. wdc7]WHF51260.1 AraC family transcriptional regulator [Chryseobacterium sp. wdc7]
MVRKTLLLFILFILSPFSSQEYYSELRKKYWEYDVHDARAFTILELYISSAKKEKNYAELYQAYADAIRYSSNKKIQYADSAIVAAQLSGNKDLIGSSHIEKGAVYYSTYRKFQPALDEYLKAYQYTKNADDQFLKYQNLYHIGVVKSYLGYYHEALELFEECIAYFEPNTKANIHKNLILNNQKGYLNSLHQIIICYQAIGNDKEAEKRIKEGLRKTPKADFFYLEKSYFEKAKGISEFKRKNYEGAISDFNQSLLGLKEKDDFTWASVVHFYRGLSYAQSGNQEKAIEDYKKVDSIFNQHHFILPEIRRNYEELIQYYKKQNIPQQELYYTKQLLKTDRIIANDFKYLSSRIHKDYDTKTLLQAKTDLENTNNFGKYLLLLSAFVILILGCIVFYWLKRKKEIQKKYDELLLKRNTSKSVEKNNSTEEIPNKNSKLEPKIILNLKKNFAEFEKNKGFLEKGITSVKLATQFGTNTSYISQFINEFKESNFNTYINKLRINYATEKMYIDKEWRKYSVEDIASACGFNNRQSFSNIFYEQTGLRPNDFIKMRKEESERSEVFVV